MVKDSEGWGEKVKKNEVGWRWNKKKNREWGKENERNQKISLKRKNKRKWERFWKGILWMPNQPSYLEQRRIKGYEERHSLLNGSHILKSNNFSWNEDCN